MDVFINIVKLETHKGQVHTNKWNLIVKTPNNTTSAYAKNIFNILTQVLSTFKKRFTKKVKEL